MENKRPGGVGTRIPHITWGRGLPITKIMTSKHVGSGDGQDYVKCCSVATEVVNAIHPADCDVTHELLANM